MRAGIIFAVAWSSNTPSATPPTTCRGWPARCDRDSVNTLFEHQAPHPLADLLRPRSLAEVVGQDHLLAAECPIGRMGADRKLSSMILWGPPGCGKTTIARLLAQGTDLVFERVSAVFSGGAGLRTLLDAAGKGG